MFFRRKRVQPPSFEQTLEALRGQGFAVEGGPGGPVRLSRGRCAAVVEPAGGTVRFVENPGLVVGTEIARLEDDGFQKFLVSHARGKQPALAEQLGEIKDFSEVLRAIFGVPSLYNEALGTVSNRYYYDRLEGRH